MNQSDNFEPSKRIKSHLDDKEELLWGSETNVIPDLIESIPGILIFSLFLLPFTAGFFIFVSMVFVRSFIVIVALAGLGFMLPLLYKIISIAYEASREEFVITDKNLITSIVSGLSVDITAVPRSDIKDVTVKQNIISELFNVGTLTFEIFQTEQETELVEFQGIDNPYNELEKIEEILKEEIEEN